MEMYLGDVYWNGINLFAAEAIAVTYPSLIGHAFAGL